MEGGTYKQEDQTRARGGIVVGKRRFKVSILVLCGGREGEPSLLEQPTYPCPWTHEFGRTWVGS